MILHGHPLSGNTHKVRLLLSALRLDHDERAVDVTTGAQKTPDFLALNPRGQLPVLVDGDSTVFDAQAILVYLARKYDKAARWLPDDPADMARVVAWLSFAANEIQNSAQLARMHFLLGVPVALEQAQAATRAALALLESRLGKHTFLELERPTIADLACYPCVALAPEGKVALDDYPQVRRWIGRLRALPFHVPLRSVEVSSTSSSIHRALRAAECVSGARP
jgi:glutathione S-transferase